MFNVDWLKFFLQKLCIKKKKKQKNTIFFQTGFYAKFVFENLTSNTDFYEKFHFGLGFLQKILFQTKFFKENLLSMNAYVANFITYKVIYRNSNFEQDFL